MNFELGINTGFAVNRYAEPDEWSELIAIDLGVRHIQLTADLINPSLPDHVLTNYVASINKNRKRYGFNIPSTFTGTFTRVNHFAHPNPEIRKYWMAWFKKFVDLSVDIGAISVGSHLGIFTVQDNLSLTRRRERSAQNIDCWHELAAYGKSRGLQYLTWEPMSISREQGETIKSARELQTELNLHSEIPIYMCLDVDHGDISSKDPQDTDPYAWLETFGSVSPLIHIKQSKLVKGGHYPFTAEHNREGKIVPRKLLQSLERSGSGFEPTLLILELSFREREPADSLVVKHLKESVDYWQPYLNVCANAA